MSVGAGGARMALAAPPLVTECGPECQSLLRSLSNVHTSILVEDEFIDGVRALGQDEPQRDRHESSRDAARRRVPSYEIVDSTGVTTTYVYSIPEQRTYFTFTHEHAKGLFVLRNRRATSWLSRDQVVVIVGRDNHSITQASVFIR